MRLAAISVVQDPRWDKNGMDSARPSGLHIGAVDDLLLPQHLEATALVLDVRKGVDFFLAAAVSKYTSAWMALLRMVIKAPR